MDRQIYKQMADYAEMGMAVTLRTALPATEEGAVSALERSLSQGYTAEADSHGRRCVRARWTEAPEGFALEEPLLPQERLLIMGGGHIALALSEIAVKCGFSVTIVDDREEFASPERFPWASQVLCGDFPEAIRALSITEYDFVVVITRGHSHDADCLRAILPGAMPAYFGMIGSRRRVRGLMEQLAGEGFPAEKLERICAPIGLDIGAVTPMEIAISILAQLVAYKRLPGQANGAYCCNESDLELAVVRALGASAEPCAAVTVLETKGSTPRKAGAKMLVRPDGSIVGSVGGGASEGAAIRKARKIIGTGTYCYLQVDMTGEVAKAVGDDLVCGGIMKMLIEDI